MRPSPAVVPAAVETLVLRFSSHRPLIRPGTSETAYGRSGRHAYRRRLSAGRRRASAGGRQTTARHLVDSAPLARDFWVIRLPAPRCVLRSRPAHKRSTRPSNAASRWLTDVDPKGLQSTALGAVHRIEAARSGSRCPVEVQAHHRSVQRRAHDYNAAKRRLG